jgi:predicted HNH restriction endonuclease
MLRILRAACSRPLALRYAHKDNTVIYLFQRIIQNHFQWIRPSPGRLGPLGEGEYVQEHGFGHEDWNFNKNLLIDGYMYGYCYYQPTEAKRDESFNIAFATYTNKQWYLIGFYLNCEFIEEPTTRINIITQKANDIKQLGNSLGGYYQKLEEQELISTLEDEAQWLKWRVRPDNAIRTNQPIPIPKTLFNSKNYRITKPTALDDRLFDRLYSLAEENISFDYIDDSEFPEGKEQEITHKTRERNPALIKKAKDKFKEKHGNLYCEICNFDFQEKYGEVGNDFIEAHHTIPVSELNGETKTKLKDIVLVCSNCHRMLHRRRPWLKIDNLKDLIDKKA